VGAPKTLKTVRVPNDIAPRFAEAEELVSRYFRDRKDDAEHGTIEIFGERYVLVRAASLSVEFFSLVEELYGPNREREADEFARNILYDLAHAIGKSDAQNFHAKMGLTDPIARLSAGPVHFSHTGWAFVDISAESTPLPSEEFYLLYDHPYSFESEAWVRAGRTRDFPVCIMNAGYSSGWCEESFGITLVAAEVLCRARGDASCRFIMAHPSRIEDHVAQWIGRNSGVSEPPRTHQIPDFFARKRAEEELRRAHDELERRVAERTAELSASNELLKREMAERQRMEKQLTQAQKLEAIGRLAGGIAHDFNNLMAVVIGSCTLLRRRVDSDPAGEVRLLVDQIEETGQKAASLTHQLLAFSRVRPMQREVLDLNAVVRELVRMLERLIGEDVQLEIQLTDSGTSINCDRAQIEQVVMNLVVNARDAMTGGGKLGIVTRETIVDERNARELGVSPGPFVVLEVSDTGMGMDEETTARIFDPFFTTKDGRFGITGTGLGLSTVYGIVKQSDGAITVDTAKGKGARFVVYLPSEVASEVEPQVRAPSVPPGGETILLVEDQKELRGILARVLRDLGYEVLEAEDAAQALAVVSNPDRAIDLLMTDVVMPHKDGVQLAREVRAMRPSIRVLFMSGYADEATASSAVTSDYGWLRKPFANDLLARKVREVLDA